MRELSYSTSPRLTALVLCAPVDKHDRNNSEKKLSLTPGRVSAWCSTVPTDISRHATSRRMSRMLSNRGCVMFLCQMKLNGIIGEKSYLATNDSSRPIVLYAKNHWPTIEIYFDRSENRWCPKPIGTNTDLTHSPRYKPFSTLVFTVWDPLRTHERDRAIARWHDHSDLNRDKKIWIPLAAARSATFRSLSYFFLSIRDAWTVRRHFFFDTFENRSRDDIDHS